MFVRLVAAELSRAYCRRMRHAYRVELDEVRVDLARLARRAGQMMTDASTALWRADLPLAESVVSSSSQITTALCPDLDHRFVCLLALQAPVAPERRLIVAAMDAVSHLLRMGKLAGHIAKITRMKHPLVALPEDLEPVFAGMAQLASTLALEAASAIEHPERHCAEHLVSAEQQMATWHRQIFQRLRATEWSHSVEQAVDAALVARYHARFADHAVTIARQTHFLITGHHPSADTPGFPPNPPSRRALPSGIGAPSWHRVSDDDAGATRLGNYPLRPTGAVLSSAMRRAMRWWSTPAQQGPAAQRTPLIVGPAAVDIVRRRVIIEGFIVHLPGREAAILEVLMRHAGRVVSLRELCAAIGERPNREDHVIRWVHRLTRRLMINPLLPPLIESVRNAGYRYLPTQRPDDTEV